MVRLKVYVTLLYSTPDSQKNVQTAGGNPNGEAVTHRGTSPSGSQPRSFDGRKRLPIDGQEWLQPRPSCTAAPLLGGAGIEPAYRGFAIKNSHTAASLSGAKIARASIPRRSQLAYPPEQLPWEEQPVRITVTLEGLSAVADRGSPTPSTPICTPLRIAA